MHKRKLKKLITSFKKFNKDDLLVIFTSDTASQEQISSLAEAMLDFEGSKGLNLLILPKSYDIKKIKFVGAEGKKVKKSEVKDDNVIIEFEDVT